MAGYSDTRLVQKLGIKEGFRFALVNAPEGFHKELRPVPLCATLSLRLSADLDFILVFPKSERTLQKEFARLASRLKSNGMLWVAWPKKSSGVATDLSFERVQRIGLEAGLVDVKICAINDIWSGLKFVFRLRDR